MNDTMFKITPTVQSKTERRRLRQEVRGWLGTGRDDPPNLFRLLRAARLLDTLLRKTTNANYRLRIERAVGGTWAEPTVDEMNADTERFEDW